jgi:membrane protease YdiL (CAAX protease family)
VKETIWWASQLLWLVVSIVLLLRLKVFRSQPLADAPGRRSNLSLLSVAGVILFYVGTLLTTQVTLGVFYRPGSTPATASAPATTAATTPATTPATTMAGVEDTHAAMVFQWADAFTKILAVGVILVLCRKLVAGGIDGWGLSLRKLPAGIGYGLLGFLVIYPLLVVINAVMEGMIEHFQKRTQETHETLQLLGRHDISSWERLTFVLVAGLFAPVLEEIFFRGLVQTVFTEKGWGFLPYDNEVLAGSEALATGDSPGLPPGATAVSVRHRWAAILVTSFLFAFIHLMPDSFLVLFVLAIGLGYVYERTGNLWASITLHAAFNCLNMYLFTHSGS